MGDIALREVPLLNGSRASSPDRAYTAHFKIHNSELPDSASKPRPDCGGTDSEKPEELIESQDTGDNQGDCMMKSD